MNETGVNSANLKIEATQAREEIERLRRNLQVLKMRYTKEIKNYLVEVEALQPKGYVSGNVNTIAKNFGIAHTPLKEGDVRRTDTYDLDY